MGSACAAGSLRAAHLGRALGEDDLEGVRPLRQLAQQGALRIGMRVHRAAQGTHKHALGADMVPLLKGYQEKLLQTVQALRAPGPSAGRG